MRGAEGKGIAIVIGGALALAPGCYWFGGCPDDAEDSYEDALLVHVEDDLDCKRADVTYAFLKNPGELVTARAEGCGKVATYDCREAARRQCGVVCSLRGEVTRR